MLIMNSFNIFSGMFLSFIMLLVGCQSTPSVGEKRNLDSSEMTATSSDYEKKIAFGYTLADRLNSVSKENNVYEIDRVTLENYGVSKEPELHDFLKSYSAGMILRLKNTVKDSDYWSFNGVRGDDLYFSAMFGGAPVTMIFKVAKNVRSMSKFSIVDYKLVTHSVWTSNVLSTYLIERDALKEIGYFSIIKKLTSGTASLNDVLEFQKGLPKRYQRHLVILNELLSLITVEFLDATNDELSSFYDGLSAPNHINAGLWFTYFYKSGDFDSMGRMADFIVAEHSQSLPNFKFLQAIIALEFDKVEYGTEMFMEAIRLNPNASELYFTFLFLLIEKERFEKAGYIMAAMNKQFNIELSKEDFEGLSPDKVDAFITTEASRTTY